MPDTDQLEAQNAQRAAAKAAVLTKVFATFDDLEAKAAAEDEFSITLDPAKGPVWFHFVAIAHRHYDELITASPPTMEQKARGLIYDDNKFAPKLLAEVCVEPKMSEAQWVSIFKNPAWSPGDVRDLYERAIDLCRRGLDVNPTESGSATTRSSA